MDGNYFDYHYLSDDVQREVEALFYDYPYIDTHIGNLGKQLKEAEEDVIGSIGASFVSIVGSKTNKAHDSTSTAAIRLVDNRVKESIQAQIDYYRGIKKSTERILSFMGKYFANEKKFIELYYFKRLRPAEIARRLDLTQHSITNLRKRAIFRAAEMRGLIR